MSAHARPTLKSSRSSARRTSRCGGQLGGSAQPQVLGAGEPLVSLALEDAVLAAPHPVDRLVQMFDDVELVAHDLAVGPETPHSGHGYGPALGRLGPTIASDSHGRVPTVASADVSCQSE